MSEVELSISFPLDSGGFLRRACPNCGREFKWHQNESPDAAAAETPYFCPYCRVQAEPGEWFTEEQAAYIQDEMMEHIVGPSLEGLAESMRDLERRSGGFIKARFEPPARERAVLIFEPDDMRVVAFFCHPEEPVKVEEAWHGPVYCLICGEPLYATT